MGLILLIVVVLVLCGGGLGYSGYSRAGWRAGGYGRGHYYAIGGIDLILVIILIFWLLGGSGHMGRW